MKAVFTIAGDGDGQTPAPSFDLGIGFSGVPGKVVLEINRIDFRGFSGGGHTDQTEERRVTVPVCRTVLEASHARAIASAMLSAATEAK